MKKLLLLIFIILSSFSLADDKIKFLQRTVEQGKFFIIAYFLKIQKQN